MRDSTTSQYLFDVFVKGIVPNLAPSGLALTASSLSRLQDEDPEHQDSSSRLQDKLKMIGKNAEQPKSRKSVKKSISN